MSEGSRSSSYGDENDLNLHSFIGISRGANRAMKRASGIFREHGLTTMQFAVLEVLYHKGDLKIGEIIEKILSTGGNMTVVIRNLEKQGYITKVVDPKDKRSMLIDLSDSGKNLIDDCFNKHMEYVKSSLQDLSKEDKNIVIDILRKVK